MVKHYLISSLRSLRGHRVFTIVSVLGLSVALLASMAILKHVAYERSFDSFQKNADDLYRLSVSYTDIAGNYDEYPGLSNVLGPKLTNDIPEILESVRVFPLKEAMRHTILSAESSSGLVQFDIPNIMAVDQSAFELFTFEILNGSPSGFSSASNSISINESVAVKLFGTFDPIGKKVELNGGTVFTVSSVFKDWPNTSHFHPEILVQMRLMEELKVARPNLHFLGGDSFYTYLKLGASNPDDLIRKLEVFTNENRREQDSEDAKLHLMPFHDIHLNSATLSGDMAEVKNGKTLNLLVLLAALILLIAWFNLINLTTSGSLRRAKEVAIRRIHGATKYAMFSQLLIETVLIATLASVLTLTLNQFMGSYLSQIVGLGSLSDLGGNSYLTGGLIAFIVLGILISAIYPSILLSAFKNPELIKGKLGSSGNTNWMKKAMIVTQYAITIGLVFGTITVIQQIRFMKSLETKMAIDQVLVLKGPGVRNPEFTSFRDGIKLLRNELKSISGIESVSTSNSVPGFKMDFTANLSNPLIHGSNPHYVKRIFADESFADVYDIEVTAGRFFKTEPSENIDTRPIVVSESAAIDLGFDPPGDIVGQIVSHWNFPIRVIGVVEDFRMESADLPIEPVYFFPTYDTKYFSMRLSSSHPDQLISKIKDKWEKIYPGNPFDWFYSKARFDQQYGSFDQFEKQLLLLTILSIGVACLGMFAIAFNAARARMKEVGIRKVLGAGIGGILKLFVGDYVRLILVSALFALPLVYYALNNWLDNYANKIDIGPGLLLWPVLGVLLLATLVIGLQTLKTARTNPVVSLRQE